MPVSEGQTLGALTVLMLALFYYGFSSLNARQTVPEPSVPWGHQSPGSVAVEVRGAGAEGIYFMPKGTAVGQMSKITGLPEGNEKVGSPKRLISGGDRFVISPAGEITSGEMSAAGRLALGLQLDLNRASAADLSLVPGIGDRMAEQIIRLRLENGAFRDLSDLMAVPGIKEKKLNSLKDYLMVRRAP